MCLDFHPQSPALLAVGLYDGTVQVYDVRNKNKKPIYQSTVRTQKHTDPVWQVRWNEDISKNFNFFSISSDGRVMSWSLMKNKLEPEEVIRLKLVGSNILINSRKLRIKQLHWSSMWSLLRFQQIWQVLIPRWNRIRQNTQMLQGI